MSNKNCRILGITILGFFVYVSPLIVQVTPADINSRALAQDRVFIANTIAAHTDTITVTFTVTIPYWTLASDSIYLTGSATVLSNNTNPQAVLLSKVNEVTWTVSINLPVGENVTYLYTRGTWSSQAKRQHNFTVPESDSVRYDAVVEWQDFSSPVAARDDFIGMAALVDFPAPFVIDGYWDRDGSGNYSDLAETYKTVHDRTGLNWVGFPEGAFYSQLLPLPVIVNEDQGMRDLNEAEFTRIAEMAHKQGLKYYVHAGNCGMTQQLADQLGTDNPFAWVPENISEADTAWWDEWFKQWGDFLEPKAIIAESIGIELFSIGAHFDYVDLDFNVSRWTNLINRIRNVYSGKVTYFSLNYRGPTPAWASQLDYIGVYMGRPIASTNEPSLSELMDGISAVVDDLPHDKPVIFYLDFASIDSAAMGASAPDILEPTAHLSIDFQEQADIYEAFFRIMEEREWIAGFLTWNYAYFDDYFYFPDTTVQDDMRFTSSIRNKLAEAVTYKWRYTLDSLATVGVNAHTIYDIPQRFGLFQNYPNPFNTTTTIEYYVSKASRVVLKVYNLTGQQVKTVVNEVKQPGYYNAQWDGKNKRGQDVSSGVYFYRFKTKNMNKTQKMILLR